MRDIVVIGYQPEFSGELSIFLVGRKLIHRPPSCQLRRFSCFFKDCCTFVPSEFSVPRIIVFATFDSTIPFIFILFVINFGFTQSFYLLSYRNPSLDAFDPYNSFLFTFIYMTGQANWQDIIHTSSPELAKALLSLFMVLNTILKLLRECKREQCKLTIEHSIYVGFHYTNHELIALIRRNELERMDEEKCQRVRMVEEAVC